MKNALVAQQAELQSMSDTVQRLEAEMQGQREKVARTEREIAEGSVPKPSFGKVGNATTKVKDIDGTDQGKSVLHAAMAGMPSYAARAAFVASLPDGEDRDEGKRRLESMDHDEADRDYRRRQEGSEPPREERRPEREEAMTEDERKMRDGHNRQMAALAAQGDEITRQMGFQPQAHGVVTASGRTAPPPPPGMAPPGYGGLYAAQEQPQAPPEVPGLRLTASRDNPGYTILTDELAAELARW